LTTQTWKTLIQRADRDWTKNAVRPVAYEFSNGREFKVLERPGVAYGTGTAT